MPRQPTVTERYQQLLVDAKRLNSDSDEVAQGKWGPETANSYYGAVMDLMQGVWRPMELEVAAKEQPAVLIPELVAALETEAMEIDGDNVEPTEPEPNDGAATQNPNDDNDDAEDGESDLDGDNDEE